MTDIMEVRRKGFEEWYAQDCKANAGFDITVEKIDEWRGEFGDYRERAALHGKWVGWNAALDSVCVELPNHPDPRIGYSDHGYGISQGINLCRQAI